ncbi:MAG TPA: Ppx/GppA phosphatase family protein [Actinomycetota bacterium]|nr:Ppx/GppA phosphatase family protein [Actinomycetota bacterium]
MRLRVGVIDVGTNTSRLLVAESTAGGYRTLDRRLIFTRLGEGVDSSGVLTQAAVDRTLAAVAEFCATCGELDVRSVHIAGTSALRDASNAEIFIDAATRLAGSPARVLTGAEEAELTFSGATSDLDYGSYLVVDIGGGSTEFVIGEPIGRVRERISVDIGAVRLTEKHLLSDPPATEEILTMEGEIEEALDRVEQVITDARESKLVGVAGTVTSLSSMFLGLEQYDAEATHHHRLARAAVTELYRQLAATPVSGRLQIPSLPEGRADIIVAGCSILARTMARWNFEEVIVSEKDILDGLVIQMLEQT